MEDELDDTEHLLSSDKNKERLLESIERVDSVSDEYLLGVYMFGFNDELNNSKDRSFESLLEKRAYNLGRLDALVGDDVRSVDYKSNSEIVNKIRKI
jgi:hypothetical protein